MKNQMAPVPTEFRSVRYRSKSEAMFAAYLDRFNNTRFIYEPNLNFPDHQFDFLLTQASSTQDCHYATVDVIEYKPTKPTETYVDLWDGWCDALLEDHPGEGPHGFLLGGIVQVQCMLYFGNIWTPAGQRGFLVHRLDRPPDLFRANWMEGHESYLRSIRFDLPT